MKPMELDYFYGNDAEQFTFYRIPKVLFTDQRYKSVSVEAKVLYGLLLDRMSLSIRNDWLDADGRVYIYFTLEEAIEFLGFGKDKLVKLYQELDRDRGIGLIERKKQGPGKPTKIYVKNFTIPGDAPLTSEKPKSEPSAALQTSEMAKSRLRSGRSADCGISASNYTDKKDTEWSDTESIYPPPPPQVQHTGKGRRRLRMDEILVFTAPVAFAMGASQSTSNIFKSWCRMFGGQLFLLLMNAWCLRLFTPTRAPTERPVS